MDAIGERNDTPPWQVRQAADVLRIYRYQYRRADDVRKPGTATVDFPVKDNTTLLTSLQKVLRLRHYARSTERSYLHWVRRFLDYRKRAGRMGTPTVEDVKAFLTRLAMVENVSASTQNQAFSALLLLFREVLHKDMEEMAKTVRAKRGRKLPTVLSVAEVQALLDSVAPEYALMVRLLYGSGVRLMELLRLRVKDIDFDVGLIVVRSGKGDKDRTTLLPISLHESLKAHLRKVMYAAVCGLRAGFLVDVVEGIEGEV